MFALVGPMHPRNNSSMYQSHVSISRPWEAMICSGACFNVGQFHPINDPEPQWDVGNAPLPIHNGHMRNKKTAGIPPLYLPLKPWQTRLLRLPSADEFSFATYNRLKARLFVVDLPVTEGAVVASEQRVVHYTALSYTWGDPPIGHTLLCDEHEISITANLAAALLALQSHTEEIYVWVDAVCINQGDRKEVAEQVVKMLQIYQKAELVVGWLGIADAHSTLAISLIRNRGILRRRMRQADLFIRHSSLCIRIVEVTLGALTSLLQRSWLRRTWVRQEIYGARTLVVQCGSQTLQWDEFAEAGHIIRDFERLFPGLKIRQRANVAAALYLASEAKKNRAMLQNGSKIPRNFSEVLLMSKYFGVGTVQDTVYGVLGMCAVPSSAGINDQATYDPHSGGYVVGVDHSKTVADVYLDAALHLLGTERVQSLVDLWHYYRRSPRHDQGMPTWVTDWREGVYDEEERQAIQEAHKATFLPGEKSKFHRPSPNVPSECGQYISPKPTKGDPRILQLSCKVMSYVAYVSDFTADLKPFISPDIDETSIGGPSIGGPWSTFGFADPVFWLGEAARSIHSETRPRSGHYLFKSAPGIRFQEGMHKRRLAILGTWTTAAIYRRPYPQLVLVPASVRKGDLVVAVGSKLLPFILRPLQGSAVSAGLFSDPDPYEEASHLLRPPSVWSSADGHPTPDKLCKKRSRKVSAILNNASVSFGTDYEFHGPVLSPMFEDSSFSRRRDSYIPIADMADGLPLQDFRLH